MMSSAACPSELKFAFIAMYYSPFRPGAQAKGKKEKSERGSDEISEASASRRRLTAKSERFFHASKHEDVLFVIGQQFGENLRLARRLVLPPGLLRPKAVFAGKVALQAERLFNFLQSTIQSRLPAFGQQIKVLEFPVEHHAKLCGDDGKIKSHVSLHLVGNRPAIERQQAV